MAFLQGPAKLTEVTRLIDDLTRDLTDEHLSPQRRDTALEELKIHGRDPRNADPIFSKQGIETLTKHSFDSSSLTTSRNALRCLCNALLLNQDARKSFVGLGYEGKACERLKSDNVDDEFLISRVLFLTTYGTSVDLKSLIEEHKLATTVAKNLERHAARCPIDTPSANPMVDMALFETLKLLFNVTHYCREATAAFNPVVSPVITLLCKGRFRVTKPLDPPVGSLVNAMLNLDLGAEDVQPSLYPEESPEILADRLIELLTSASQQLSDEELESSATSVVGVLRAVHEYAPGTVKATMRTRLLPDESDRSEVLGQSQSLPSWLLKNTTNAVTPHLREGISDLLFDLSDKDPTTFVNNVGFGFASGYLFNRNLPVPENPGQGRQQDESRPVNPVTGQFLDAERQPEGPEMTEEEKEREAERLFVLFERLRANGVISVENPLRTAVESGQFEELSEDKKGDELD